MKAAVALAALLAAGAAAGAGEIPRATVVLEALTPGLPHEVPEAAPPRFVLMEDGQVYVGGGSRLLTAKLSGGGEGRYHSRVVEPGSMVRRTVSAVALPNVS